ncbi:MAG: glycosyltransferase family 39 protein, partial [Anaerolineales bacterium]|nr:glycosyltransferase family 39 protein [Anaerolineales bacterium]
LWTLTLALTLLAGFALRLYDLTDLPLDFAPTRQLFSALKARAMYYEALPGVDDAKRDLAIRLGSVGNIEPPIMEMLVSRTWLLIGEHLWVARVYSSLFWVLGGLALFLLIRELTSCWPALIGLLLYLFAPLSVIASRSFQPDPLMTALFVFALWALVRWQNTHAWKWAILLGLFGGAALLVKNVIVFMLGGAVTGVALGSLGLKRALRDPQVWTIGGLFLLPTLFYALSGSLSGSLAGYFTLQFFPNLWVDPAFYFRWAYVINYNLGFSVAFLGILGIFLAEPQQERPLLAGLWIGYLLYGLVFAYATYTHYYYQLPLIPLVAISMSVGLQLFFERFFERSPGFLPRLILIGLTIFSVAWHAWVVRNRLADDYRHEAAFWAEIGEKLGQNASVVCLAHDYGYRLAYWGWQSCTPWYTSADIEVRYQAGLDIDYLQKFREDTAGKQYFLVTLLGEFEKQPTIKNLLYENYPVYVQTDEYIIFNLQP